MLVTAFDSELWYTVYKKGSDFAKNKIIDFLFCFNIIYLLNT